MEEGVDIFLDGTRVVIGGNETSGIEEGKEIGDNESKRPWLGGEEVPEEEMTKAATQGLLGVSM